MLDDGYSIRKKSKWVSEALESLIQSKSFCEYVAEEKPFGKLLDSPEKVYLTINEREKLDEAIGVCRKYNPLKEGMQSAIIRTAIVQRILARCNVYRVNKNKKH